MPDAPALDATGVGDACQAMLEQHPHAPVAAIGEQGMLVAIPDSFDVGDHPVMAGRSALDMVVPADRGAVIAAGERIRQAGVATLPVRLASNPTIEVQAHLFDMRPTHGALLVVLVGASPIDTNPPVAAEPVLRPRLFCMRKNDIATLTHVDEAVTGILGWRPEDLVGRGSLEFVHPEDQTRGIEHWMEMLGAPGSRRRLRLRHRHVDGRWVWLELTNTNRLDDPVDPHVQTEAVDISDEMAAHEAVRASEQLLRRIAETMPLGLMHVDADRRVVYANERLEQILGAASGDTVDAQLGHVIPADREELEFALTEVLGAGHDADVEVRVRLPGTSGDRRARLRLGALADDEGGSLGAIICVDDVTERARLHAELERRAEFDVLTACRSRSSIMAALEEALAKGPVGVVFLDLDGFKAINDTHGHAIGDAVLEIVGLRLRGVVRAHDLVGRLGGDEFLVVCTEVVEPASVMAWADRLAARVSEPIGVGALTVSIRASIGVALSGESISAERLVADADVAMYEAKRTSSGPRRYTHSLRSHAD